MKRLFYLGAIGLLVFEIAQVYFIMPMPGSQRMDSLPLAYFLYHWRWIFRIGFVQFMLAGGPAAFRASRYARWVMLLLIAAVGIVAYMSNVEMSADKMFRQPRLILADAKHNKVPLDKLIIGYADRSGEARAYPIQYLGYHHQVLDRMNGTPLMVTYCNVCRTGRIFSPIINGKVDQFRLVGMDHFNAMFEDATTGTWWRQATGEAVAGPLQGDQLLELPSSQTTLRAWLALHFNSQVMQPDSAFTDEYADMDSYDLGVGRGPLTGTDTASWHDKSWVVGLQVNDHVKAYDWNRVKQEGVINDTIGNQPIVLVLGADKQSFFAYQRLHVNDTFSLHQDTLVSGWQTWQLTGLSIAPTTDNLQKVPAYQEFWHSWRTFHPHTTRY